MSKINKKQNPKIGINTILLRDAKGRSTKSYFKAKFFYLRTPTGHTSKRQEFPKEIKKTADKELFLKKLLTQLFQINEKKRQQQREYREKKAKREGRQYKPRKQKIETIADYLGENEVGLEKLARKIPELFSLTEKGKQGEFVVSTQEYLERRKKLEARQKTYKRAGAFTGRIVDFIPASVGRPVKKTENWYEKQIEQGLIKIDKRGKVHGEKSIRWTLTRYLQSFLTKDRIVKLKAAYGARNTLFFDIFLITSLEKHNIVLSVKASQSLEISTNLQGQSWKEARDRFQARATEGVMRTLYSTRDYPDQRLTSSDIYFQVRSKSQPSIGLSSTRMQNFKLSFFITLTEVS